MRFVHIGDLHLGKMLNFQSLLEVQADLLDQILDYLITNQIDVLVMAGDIYDRSIPSGEAVALLNDFLTKLVLKHQIKVLMIAGNHDSASRLNFVTGLLKNNGLYIEAYPPKKLKPVVIDGVNFYLLPFFKPSHIRYLYQQNDLSSYNDAFKYYLSKQEIDYQQTNVLITHQFLAGNQQIIRSESEAILNVGGSELIDVSLVKDFDYVALGHLHASQQVMKETIRYSGSLMAYSFDEVKQNKSIVDVTIDHKNVNYQLVTLKPKRKLIKIVASFDELIDEKYPGNSNDYVAIELLDQILIPNAGDYLKVKFPHLLQLTYQSLNDIKKDNQMTKADIGFEKLDAIQLFEQFYQKMKNQTLSDEAKEIVSEILLGGENHVT